MKSFLQVLHMGSSIHVMHESSCVYILYIYIFVPLLDYEDLLYMPAQVSHMIDTASDLLLTHIQGFSLVASILSMFFYFSEVWWTMLTVQCGYSAPSDRDVSKTSSTLKDLETKIIEVYIYYFSRLLCVVLLSACLFWFDLFLVCAARTSLKKMFLISMGPFLVKWSSNK